MIDAKRYAVELLDMIEDELAERADRMLADRTHTERRLKLAAD